MYHVVVGETKHPMLEDHFIEWITLSTNQGIYRKQCKSRAGASADFCLCDGELCRRSICVLQSAWITG